MLRRILTPQLALIALAVVARVDNPTSAFGTKQTSNYRPTMSAFGGKADINGWQSDVCF
jgi:hypothetical protein